MVTSANCPSQPFPESGYLYLLSERLVEILQVEVMMVIII